MYYECRLVLKNYEPVFLEPGMYFVNPDGDLYQLDHTPPDMKEYLNEHGYPVELYIVDEGNPNLDDGFVVAEPHQIGWFDAGDDVEELEDVSIDLLNLILQEYEGFIDIELDSYPIDDDECQGDCEEYEPLLIQGKVVIRLLSDDETTEEEYEEGEDFPDFHSNY